MESKRILNLDIARTVAILCVVLCHAIQCIYKFNLQTWNSISFMSKTFMLVFFTISRLGVPIFLCLTGALILKKKFEKEEDCLHFYKKKLIPLIITTEIWIIFYNIYLASLNNWYNGDFVVFVKFLLKNMLFFNQVSLPNMWYMPMIIGMYVVLPFLSLIVNKFNFKILKYPLFLSIIVNMLIPTINLCLKLYDKKLGLIIDKSFLGGAYGIYIVLGYYVFMGGLRKIKIKNIIIVTIFSFVATILMQYYLFENGYSIDLWYNNILLCMCAIGVFEIFNRIIINNSYKINKYIESISKYSLGIFFVHIVVQKSIYKIIKKLLIIESLKVLLVFFIVFIISVFVVWLGNKFKFAKKYVFLND